MFHLRGEFIEAGTQAGFGDQKPTGEFVGLLYDGSSIMNFTSRPAAKAVKFDGNMLRVAIEIRVGGEDFQSVPDCRSADEQVRARALDAAVAKPIVEPGGGFIVFLVQRQIRVEAEIFFELFETPGWIGA